MTDPNPYASPTCAADAGRSVVAVVGAWRQGEYLVMHREAPLPPCCVFTGEPAAGFIEFDFVGPGERYQLLLILNRYDVTLSLPVNRAIRRSYHGNTLLLYAMNLVGVVLATAMLVTLSWSVPIGVLCGVGATVSFVIAAWTSHLRPSLALYDIDANYIWLRGAAPEFLSQLQEWPFGPA